jgi:hypothetical protein
LRRRIFIAVSLSYHVSISTFVATAIGVGGHSVETFHSVAHATAPRILQNIFQNFGALSESARGVPNRGEQP